MIPCSKLHGVVTDLCCPICVNNCPFVLVFILLCEEG